jgi:hypothetical protein
VRRCGVLVVGGRRAEEGLGSGDQELGEAVLAPQMMPIVTPGGVGGLGEAGVMPVIPFLIPSAFGIPLGMSEGEDLARDIASDDVRRRILSGGAPPSCKG